MFWVSGYLACVSHAFLRMACHSFAVKLPIALLALLLTVTACSGNANLEFEAPVTPPDVAPPFDEQLAAEELNDENAANTDQHSDDELAEFEPGLGTDEAALRSAFFTGSEDLCAAVFAQLGGSATLAQRRITISWCRDIAKSLPVPLTAADESVAHAAGWNDTRAAIFKNQDQLCSKTRCVTVSNFPYPF
jgi:hypothetical protein